MNTTRCSRQAQLLAAGLSLFGCSAGYPSGVIVCSESSDCPEGMSCRFERGSDDGRCFPGGDSTEREVVAPGAGTSSSQSRDASALDAAQAGSSGATGSGSAGEGGDGAAAPRPDPGPDAPRDAGPTGTESRDAEAADSAPQAGSGGSSDPEPEAGTGAAGAGAAAAGSGGTAQPAAGSGGTTDPAAGSGGDPEPLQPCEDPARECEPTDGEAAEEPCGLCNTGQRTRTRSCNQTTCRWNAWSAWSECADPAECVPDAAESRSVACSGCGSKTQTRVCSQVTCTYEAWRDASSCSWCDACGELVFCDTPDDVAPNRGTWCRPENGCDNDQAWGRCLELLADNTCLLHEPRYIGN